MRIEITGTAGIISSLEIGQESLRTGPAVPR